MLEVIHENPQTKTIEIVIDGKITQEALHRLYAEFEKKAEEWGQINLLEKYVTIDGIEPKAIWDDFSLYFKNRKIFNRVAVVTQKSWVRMITGLFTPFLKIDVKIFTLDDMDGARKWLALS